MTAVLVILGIAALLLISITTGLRGIAQLTTMAALLFAPLISLRLIPSITIGDALLVLAVFVNLARAPKLEPVTRSWKLVAGAGALMISGGMLATVFSAGGSSTSAVMLAQYGAAVFLSLALAYLARPNMAELRAFAYAYGAGAAISCAVAITDNTSPRPSGLTTHSNHLALSAALSIGVWLALFVSARKRIPQAVALAAIAVCLWGSIIAGSRAGLVAIIVAIGLTFVGTKSGKLAVIGGAALAGGVYVIATGRIDLTDPSNGIVRLLGGGTAGLADYQRTFRYRRAWDRIMENPIVGNGFVEARDGHSLYLQMWDAAGLAGIAAAILLVTAAVLGYLRARKDRRLLSIGLWSGYSGYLVAAILSNQMWDRYLWLALALALLSDRIVHAEPAQVDVPRRLDRQPQLARRY